LKFNNIIVLEKSINIHQGLNSGDIMKGTSVIYVKYYTINETNV